VRSPALLAGLLAVLAPLAAAQDEAPGDPWFAERLALIDPGPGAGWRTAFDELLAQGEPAARRALAGFERHGFVARRARAQLVVEVGNAATLARVLTLLDDPDPEVRLGWAELLGNASLADVSARERVEALAAYAAGDADGRVRSQAIESLALSALPGTVSALDALLDQVPAVEAADVARTLARLPGAERRLVARVKESFQLEIGPDSEVMAALLSGYGRALADLPRGGESAADRVPFVLGLRHPAGAVQLAARGALRTCVNRLIQFARYERAERLLARLAEEGFDAQDLLYRRAGLALSRRGDPAASLRLARALERSAEEAPREDALTWRFYGVHLQGASLFARGELEAAYEAFQRASAVLRELLGERLDLADRGHGRSPIGGAIMADRLLLLSLTELWQGFCLVARDRDVSNPVFLEKLRLAHEILLQARVMAYATDALDGFPAETLDALLERDLGPWALVVSNPRLAAWSDGRGLDVMLLLCRGLATVAPWEMPGFEPVAIDDSRLTDPLTDTRRFAALEMLREEHYKSLGRLKEKIRRRSGNLGEVGRPITREFDLRRREIDFRRGEEGRRMAGIQSGTVVASTLLYEIYSHLVSYLPPSLFALTLGASLRVEGRLSEARGLGTRMLADLRISRPGLGQIGSEWASANAELMIGSTYMDEKRPQDAERHVLEAVRRLEALENSLVEQRTRAGQGLGDPVGLESSIRQTRQMRANALLSLAVNANVRMGDPELALTYFERAFDLDQRDFMRVLRACYRARSGRSAEARAMLRGIKATPPLYYNLACTHALLGDVDEALDYLQRELIENHPSTGSLERQKAWAREDPDLQALRENPRFQRMVEAPRGP